MSEFKYFECVKDESGTGEAECRRKVACGRRAASAIKAMVNDEGLQFECDMVLH